METIETIKTPRGTFNVKAKFRSEKEANDNGFYYYFTNDNGVDIYTKYIGEYSRYFAIVEKEM
jgi:hypothetical protein